MRSQKKNCSQNKGAMAEILQVKVGSAEWSPRESGGKNVCVYLFLVVYTLSL